MTRPFETAHASATDSFVPADEGSVIEALRRVADDLTRLELHASGDDTYRLSSAARSVYLALVQLESASN